MVTYEVKVIFRVIVQDADRYPDAGTVRKAIYDGTEIPGYLRQGLDVTALGCQIERLE